MAVELLSRSAYSSLGYTFTSTLPFTMPQGRPAKYTPEEAHAARLASKKQYRERNLEAERLKSRERTRLLTSNKRVPPAMPPAIVPRSDRDPALLHGVPSLSPSHSFCSPPPLPLMIRESDCKAALSCIIDSVFGRPLPLDMGTYLEDRAESLLLGCSEPDQALKGYMLHLTDEKHILDCSIRQVHALQAEIRLCSRIEGLKSRLMFALQALTFLFNQTHEFVEYLQDSGLEGYIHVLRNEELEWQG
ncbi:hypothetical protein M422DRAFT_48186 [Sphaerobolus stellatus SS14]|uniref:Uncharacterized protein n=1 Tax=Sphaerobolus stellatus (strain SS14) TaxID=990650 RepID=A0A0C9UHL7_SPHS4|nr:hypothetical protein M422DRAFT_48186 [Sphaerobolus stellatus SS14]